MTGTPEHDLEKKALERSAVHLFIDIFNGNHAKKYRLLYLQEKPDAVLEDDRLGKLGLEITHLFYNKEEAMTVLGKSSEESGRHVQLLNVLIQELNERIAVKERKKSGYCEDYPVSLLIRNASSLYGMSDILQVKERIRKPKGIFEDIWFLSRDGADEWLLFNLDELMNRRPGQLLQHGEA
jgi:hypothetical protein